jgi:hypothetical protein
VRRVDDDDVDVDQLRMLEELLEPRQQPVRLEAARWHHRSSFVDGHATTSPTLEAFPKFTPATTGAGKEFFERIRPLVL